jgi:hypothetical protein
MPGPSEVAPAATGGGDPEGRVRAARAWLLLPAHGFSERAVLTIALVGIALFLLTSTFSSGGLADSRRWGDVGHYETFARNTIDGQIPYHDFSMEYPPGALPVFLAPALVTARGDSSGYLFRFKLLMALCNLGAALLALAVLVRLRATRLRLLGAMAAIGLAPLALGHVFLNRYDGFAALLVTGSLLALLACREVSAGVLLGAGFAAKLFALVAAPVAAIRIGRRSGRPGLARATVAALAVVALSFAFFVVVAFGGLGFSISTQLRRHLQTESLGASLLLAADRLGLHHARVVPGNPGSIDLAGRLPDAVGILTTLLIPLVVLVVALRYWHGGESDERLVVAFVASVVSFTAFAKVVSPQYLVWLIPLVPLVAGWRGRLATGLLLTALLLTQLENNGFHGLRIDDWAVWLILVRNLLLVALLWLLVRGLRPAALLGRSGEVQEVTAAVPA